MIGGWLSFIIQLAKVMFGRQSVGFLIEEEFSFVTIVDIISEHNLVVILTSRHRKKTVMKVTVFFQRCVLQAERDVHFVRDVSFGSEVCLRHVLLNTSHHCE